MATRQGPRDWRAPLVVPVLHSSAKEVRYRTRTVFGMAREFDREQDINIIGNSKLSTMKRQLSCHEQIMELVQLKKYKFKATLFALVGASVLNATVHDLDRA